MKYCLLSIVTILFLGCAKPQHPVMDDAFRPSYNAFVSYATSRSVMLDQDRIDHLTIFFDNIQQTAAGGTMIGYCAISGENQIVIDRGFWDSNDEYTREALLFHELGHCLLHRKHIWSFNLNSGFPDSVMYPYVLKSGIYDLNDDTHNYYITELFTHLNDLDSATSGCEMRE